MGNAGWHIGGRRVGCWTLPALGHCRRTSSPAEHPAQPPLIRSSSPGVLLPRRLGHFVTAATTRRPGPPAPGDATARRPPNLEPQPPPPATTGRLALRWSSEMLWADRRVAFA